MYGTWGGPKNSRTTEGHSGVIESLGRDMGESLSPCTDICFHRHREIQHLCDPEGAECQKHDHRGPRQPAQLGAGFHVVSLQWPHGLTPWHSQACCWPRRAQPDTRVSSGTPLLQTLVQSSALPPKHFSNLVTPFCL